MSIEIRLSQFNFTIYVPLFAELRCPRKNCFLSRELTSYSYVAVTAVTSDAVGSAISLFAS
jgi:hypothetical protein